MGDLTLWSGRRATSYQKPELDDRSRLPQRGIRSTGVGKIRNLMN